MTTAVYIGRFQPFHNGHAEVLTRALNKYSNVIVLVGSANQPRSSKNPWTEWERIRVIAEWYKNKFAYSSSPIGFALKGIVPVPDHGTDQEWAESIKILVSTRAKGNDIVLVGADRDESTYYFKLFPEWKLDLTEPPTKLSATWIRDAYFYSSLDEEIDALAETFVYYACPKETVNFLNTFKTTKDYQDVKAKFDNDG